MTIRSAHGEWNDSEEHFEWIKTTLFDERFTMRTRCCWFLLAVLVMFGLIWVSPSIVVAETRFFTASHKHGIGSCQGQLQLTDTSVIFASSTHPLNMRKSEIKRIDGDGIVDGNGKTWHFKIGDRSPEDTHTLLVEWFSKAQSSESLRSRSANTQATPENQVAVASQATGLASAPPSSETNDSERPEPKLISANVGQQPNAQEQKTVLSQTAASLPSSSEAVSRLPSSPAVSNTPSASVKPNTAPSAFSKFGEILGTLSILAVMLLCWGILALANATKRNLGSLALIAFLVPGSGTKIMKIVVLVFALAALVVVGIFVFVIVAAH